jgi:hypothetical protein
MPDMKAPEHADSPHAPGHPTYEKSDVNAGAILRFGIALAVIGVLIHLLILGMYGVMARYLEASQPKLSKLLLQERKQLPQDLGAIPAPRLQVSDVTDLDGWKKRQQDKLNGYGWVDEKKDIVHIPIDQALKILADPKQQAAHGIHVAEQK